MKYILIMAAAALAGCTIVPAGTAHSACELLQIAAVEADLAPAWYLEAGVVLEHCGQEGAIADGKVRACAAEARSGYREHKECEAME